MSVTQDDPQKDERRDRSVDLSDLGTIGERDLHDAREDPQLQAESRAALEALQALERDGRLIVG